MELQLVRHATLRVRYGGTRLLVDSMFAEAGELDPVPNAANGFRNPLVDLKTPIEECLDCDAVLITHRHRDHFDQAAMDVMPRGMRMYCQPADASFLQESGFHNVVSIESVTGLNDLRIRRTEGRHGLGAIGRSMGAVSGFVLEGSGEPKLYIAGDTVWCPEVEEAITLEKPDVIVLNAGGAQFREGGAITMDEHDVRKVREHAYAAKIVAVHMDAWNHCRLTRRQLRKFSDDHRLDLHIPEDGERIIFD